MRKNELVIKYMILTALFILLLIITSTISYKILNFNNFIIEVLFIIGTLILVILISINILVDAENHKVLMNIELFAGLFIFLDFGLIIIYIFVNYALKSF